MVQTEPRKVLMLAFERAQILDITGPLELFGSANDLGRAARPYAIELIAERPGPFLTTSGLALVASRGFGDVPPDELEQIDTFLVSGGHGVVEALENNALVDFIAGAATRARRVASVCSGSLLLARAGLLNGKRATTHWNATAPLRRISPDTIVEDDAIYVRDGNIWTSAGVTAGLDLTLALIESDLGHEAAMQIAQRHVIFMVRPGGQSQFSVALAAQASETGRLGKLIAWVSEHPCADLSVSNLAAYANMSERTLARVFLEETGEPPARFVECVRVDRARAMLSGTREAIDKIAVRAGFGSAERMRRAFQRHLGVNPSDFRERFGPQAKEVSSR